MRSVFVPLALCAALACVGCQKSPAEKEREQAELHASVLQKLDRERQAEARKRAEDERRSIEADKVREEQIRKESEDAFAKFNSERGSMSAVEEAAATDAAVERLRGRMDDPPAMQVRDAHFNEAKTAVCMEVNYKERGNYVGFRRAYVTPGVTWVEPGPDDLAHRVFELNLKRMGCDQPVGSAASK